jgi:uncharacterized protein (TIGR02265 family)
VDVPLHGALDVRSCVEDIPDSFVLKGMFFTRFVDQLGDDWDAIAPELEDAPQRGRYVAFRDYSQRDFVRIYCRVAAKIFPDHGLREGVRRLARMDFHVFADSTLGKVTIALVRDARTALHRLPFVYSKVAAGDFRMRVEDVAEGLVRVEFSPHYGNWEYQLGQFEGIVLAFGSTPRISVEIADGSRRFDVQITD